LLAEYWLDGFKLNSDGFREERKKWRLVDDEWLESAVRVEKLCKIKLNHQYTSIKKDELTKEQTERQDFVDNAIHNLLNELRPEGLPELEWNIERISIVRESMLCVYGEAGLKEEDMNKFYPFLEEEEEE